MMFEQPANAAPGLGDYIEAVANRRWHVLATVVACLGLAWLMLSGRVASYEASARVLVGPSRALSINEANLAQPNLEREREVVLSDENVLIAAQQLQLSSNEADLLAESVEVSFRPDSDVLILESTGTDPEEITSAVNAISEAYASNREAAESRFYAERISQFESDLAEIDLTIATINGQIDSLLLDRAAVVTLPATDPTRAPGLSAIDGQVTQQRQALNQTLTERRPIAQSLRNLQTQEGTRPATAQVLSPARVPTSATGIPSSLLYVAAGLAGLGLGTALAFALSRLDGRARSADDVTVALGRPVLARIPSFGLRNVGLVMLRENPSGRSARSVESVRRLRTSVDYLARTESRKTLLFTSAFPGEGKSTTVANLGIAFARAGQTTVMISADLRRPTLENLFELEPTSGGLGQWLGGGEDDLLAKTQLDDLYVVPAGGRATNSAELLGSGRFKLLIDELEKNFDIVLIDTPPVLATADASTAARHCDGVIVVIDGRRTDTAELKQVRADLNQAGAEVLGAVLNHDQSRNGRWWKRNKYDYSTSQE